MSQLAVKQSFFKSDMEFGLEKLHLDLHDLSDVSLNFLILLNSPSLDFSQIKQCWNYCGTRICADGGANRLYDGCNEHEKTLYTPNCIIGDLDSLRSDVAVQYKYVQLFTCHNDG